MSEVSKAKIVVVDDRVPISTVVEALDTIGIKTSGMMCIEEVAGEVENLADDKVLAGLKEKYPDVDIWIVAPWQGACEEGEAYQVYNYGVDEHEYVKETVELVEKLWLWLYHYTAADPDETCINLIQVLKEALQH